MWIRLTINLLLIFFFFLLDLSHGANLDPALLALDEISAVRLQNLHDPLLFHSIYITSAIEFCSVLGVKKDTPYLLEFIQSNDTLIASLDTIQILIKTLNEPNVKENELKERLMLYTVQYKEVKAFLVQFIELEKNFRSMIYKKNCDGLEIPEESEQRNEKIIPSQHQNAELFLTGLISAYIQQRNFLLEKLKNHDEVKWLEILQATTSDLIAIMREKEKSQNDLMTQINQFIENLLQNIGTFKMRTYDFSEHARNLWYHMHLHKNLLANLFKYTQKAQ